jgi:hypothetical protein
MHASKDSMWRGIYCSFANFFASKLCLRPINTSTELPRKVAIPKEIQVVHGVYTPALINRHFCFRVVSLTEFIENICNICISK